MRFLYIFILFQGIFSFNNGLVNASQLKLLNFNYGLSKISKEMILIIKHSKKLYLSQKDIFYSQNNDYESIASILAKSSLPSEIKEENNQIKFDKLLDLISIIIQNIKQLSKE